jgi:hypothetical protein
MKKLFGNPELIRKNKRVAYLAALESTDSIKEYEVALEYNVIETISYDKTATVKVQAKNKDQAKELAETKIEETLDSTEDITFIKCTQITLNDKKCKNKQYKDEKTLDMFRKDI